MALLSTGRYVALSSLLAGLMIWHGFSTYQEFFPSVVYLSTSKLSIAVIGNLGFAAALVAYKCLTWFFLGQLRDAELERISERVSQAVVETCLAMTIFRQDVSAPFIALFVVLSFLKIFHWLVADRVDFIDTSPTISVFTHVRLVTFSLLLLAADCLLLHYTLGKTLRMGVSLHFLFAFEAAVASSTCLVTIIKYCLSMADMAMGGRWEGKGTATFYLELTLDLLHLLVYAAFFAVVFSTHGIPLYLIRDLYWTFRNFQQRVRDFLRYRRITANMDSRFPDASDDDLARADHSCIVCREEMAAGGRAKRLPCGHVFHLHCLRSWLERQQTCPICRAPVVPAPPRPQQQAAAAAAAPEPPPRQDPYVQWDAEAPNEQGGIWAHLQGVADRQHGGAGAGLQDRAQQQQVQQQAHVGQAPLGFPPPPPGVFAVPVPWLLCPAPATATPAPDPAHHSAALAAASFVLAASLAPGGDQMAPAHATRLEELLATPGMAVALEGAAAGLDATLAAQREALGALRASIAAGTAAAGQSPAAGDAGDASGSDSSAATRQPAMHGGGEASTASAGDGAPAAARLPRAAAEPEDTSEAAQLRRRRLQRFAALEQQQQQQQGRDG